MAGRSLSRRTFLRGTGASVLAGPLILPRLLGEEASGNRLALGVIGVGGMGGGHLGRALGTPETVVVAVCDVDGKRREAARQRVHKAYAEGIKSGQYRGCDAYADFRELTRRPDIDAVIIATPDHWHALVCADAARNGKDIYCEKPLTLTIGEARELTRIVRRYGRVFQTGSQQRSEYQGRFRFACEMVRNGRLGKLLRVHVTVGGPSGSCHLPEEPVPEGMDWDLWLGPAPWRPYNSRLHPSRWRGYRDYSGGGMTDWGAHHFDIVQWALDAVGSGPVEILPPESSPLDRLTYRYANDVLVTHGGYQGKGGYGITFVGTEGRIDVSRDALQTFPESIGRTPTGPGEVHLRRSPGHFRDWLECIRSRRPPICDVAVGARSVTVCHLGNLAYWLQRPLRWDPDAWEFPDDPGAQRWVHRPMRAPWMLDGQRPDRPA